MLNRATTRIGKIDDRLELLDGFLVAFLNLDRVIEIIRTEDEPKTVMIAEFGLTDRQAEAILNMRLRSLRRLEEFEIGKERKALAREREDLAKLIESPARQRTRLKKELAAVKDKFGDARRTRIEEGPGGRAEIDWSAMIEKEPITVILSQRGWIRAMRGHVALDDKETLKFREGDGLHLAFHAQTTDRLLLVGENGRVYTLGGDKLPGGRGFGEPVRLSIDLPAEVEIAGLFVVRPEMKLLVASSDGRGFVTTGEAVLAETRKGKQLLNLREGARLAALKPVPADADAVAVLGENRKLLVFSLAELGVQLQRYRDGGLADVTVLRMAEGLSWSMGGEAKRTRTEADLTPWRAIRGASGRMAPLGFPRSNRF
jgi:topoisomerase-4 subunit A